jgi:hypothetical protein
MMALMMLACACGGGSLWQVVHKAPQNPLFGAQTYYVAPVRFDGVTFDGVPEAQWLGGRNEKQQASWANDKAVYTSLFLHQLSGKGVAQIAGGRTYLPVAGQLPNGTLVVEVQVAELGTDHTYVVTIKDAANHSVDEIRIPVRHIGGAMGIIGFANQLMAGRSALAERLDRYLRDRAKETPVGSEVASAPP